MEAIPVLSVDLIKLLDKIYPLYNPAPGESMERIQRAAGRRDVVERLLAGLKLQDEDEEVNSQGDT